MSVNAEISRKVQCIEIASEAGVHDFVLLACDEVVEFSNEAAVALHASLFIELEETLHSEGSWK